MPTWTEYGVWIRSKRQQGVTVAALRLLLASSADEQEKETARLIIAKLEERMKRRALKRGEAAA